MNFTELEAWKKGIVEDSMEWVKGVKNVTDPKILEAYEAGLKNGMAALIGILRLHDVIPKVTFVAKKGGA